MFDRKFPICSICNEHVELEASKTDEAGKAVHGDCYFLKLHNTLNEPIAVSEQRIARKPGAWLDISDVGQTSGSLADAQ